MKFNNEHGANIYDYDNYNKILDFSSNTNPLGLPKRISLDLNQEMYLRYPDIKNTKLIHSLSNYEGVDKDFFYIGNGASDIIFRVVLALKPKNTLLLAPTFSEYEKAVNSIEGTIKYYELKEENDFIVNDDILDIIKKMDLVILCNPNNPTGQIIEKELLKKIIDLCQKNNVFILIDECFIDFIACLHQYTTKDYLDEYNNLIVLKAFTKIFSMAGFRLGYCMLNNNDLKNRLFESGADWPISSIAQEVGELVLQDCDNYLSETITLISEERKYLVSELCKLNFKVYDGYANYIFFRYDGKIDLKKELLKKGILIRSCANYKRLDNSFYRICIKKRKDNLVLIEHLKEVIKWQSI